MIGWREEGAPRPFGTPPASFRDAVHLDLADEPRVHGVSDGAKVRAQLIAARLLVPASEVTPKPYWHDVPTLRLRGDEDWRRPQRAPKEREEREP